MHMLRNSICFKTRRTFFFYYVEEDNCGSIDFEHRGLRYHIWEFADDVEPVGVRPICGMQARWAKAMIRFRRTFKERILSDFISFLGYFMTPVLQRRKSHAGTV